MKHCHILTISCLLTLSACLPLPVKPEPVVPATDQAMRLFIDGIDHFDSEQRSAAFLQLEEQFAESPWNRRAKVLASLAGSIRLLEKQLKRQQALLSAQEKDHLALLDLKQENDLLSEQVKVLKSLIVDLELRQP